MPQAGQVRGCAGSALCVGCAFLVQGMVGSAWVLWNQCAQQDGKMPYTSQLWGHLTESYAGTSDPALAGQEGDPPVINQ